MRLRAAVSAAADRTAPNVEKRRNTVLCRAPAKSAPIRGAPARRTVIARAGGATQSSPWIAAARL